MNRMSRTSLRSRLTRSTAAVITSVLLSATGALLVPVGATAPHGSDAEVILETRSVTGQPYYASLSGWWGHEGGVQDKGLKPTFLSLDASDGQGVVDDATTAALHKAIGDGGDFGSLRVAFVPYSADGSNERPVVHRGENAGQAFTWFADLGFGGSLNGNRNKNDGVNWVSTLAEYTKWWNAGRPVQAFTDQLKVLDVASSGATHLSSDPEGASILDRWPTGTKISLVFYVSDGVDKAMPQIPTVKVGPDGRALTSWLTFVTVASPTNAARTSGGYRVLTGQGTGPDAAAKPRKAPTPGQATDRPSGAAAAAAGGPAAGSPADSATDRADDTGFISSLPGGRPTFWILLALVAAGGVAGVAWRMRASAGGRSGPIG